MAEDDDEQPQQPQPVAPAPPTPAAPSLDPEFAGRLQQLRDAAGKAGIQTEIRSGARSTAEQADIYRRYHPLGWAAAPPGTSYHEYGLAADLMQPDGTNLNADQLGQLAKMAPQFGLYPGANFNDPSHFQIGIAGGGSNYKQAVAEQKARNAAAPVTPVSTPVQRPADNPGEFEQPVTPGVYTAAQGAGTPAVAPNAMPLPAVEAAIGKATQSVNVPADYLRVTSMIESAGGRNPGTSSAGAVGDFQFIPSTAASYGVQDRNDPDQSALGAARYALDNKLAMEKALGRPVTWDEVYLGHQQGGANAAALIANPDKRAGDIVGDAAIKNNGGDPNGTAAQFVNLWRTKYNNILAGMGGVGAPPRAGYLPSFKLPAQPAPAEPAPYTPTTDPPSAIATAHDAAVQTGAVTYPGQEPIPDATAAGLGLPAGFATAPLPAAASGAGLWDIVTSAYRSQEYGDNTFAREEAMNQAVILRNAAIKQAMGVELDNPFGPDPQAWAFAHPNLVSPAAPTSQVMQARMADYERQLAALQQAHPEHAGIIGANRPVEYDARGIAGVAAGQEEDAYAAQPAGPLRTGAWLLGRLAGTMRDPLMVGSLFVGGPEIQAAGTLGKIAVRGLTDAAINAGTAAIAQPEVQAWRADRGLESGFLPAAKDVGMAALFGGILGSGVAAVHGIFGALKGLEPEIPKLEAGDPAAVARVADAMPPGVAPGLKATATSEVLDRAAKPAPVPGVPIAPADSAELLRLSIRHAEDPVNEPPPEPPSVALTPPPREAHLADTPASRTATEPLPLPTPDHPASFDYGGKPVSFETFKPSEVGTDAATFQYKGGADVRGVTDRLGTVGQWDPVAGGNVVVFERSDGSQFIADGHQRLALAQRLEAQGDSIGLSGYVFREADGWTPQDVRAIAAKKNIQEGSGDVLDTARVLRERPDLWDATLPMSDAKIKQVQGLARLSPEAWQITLNGQVPPLYGAAVGRMVDDTATHQAVMNDLITFKPANEQQARLVIRDAVEAGFSREVQDTLFGPTEMTRSLTMQRAQVFSGTIKLLGEDKKVFGVLDREQSRIEAAGNTLAPEANIARATRAAQLSQALETLATRSGAVSSALNKWAAQVAQGLQTAKAARGFADELVRLIEEEGLHLDPRPVPDVAQARPKIDKPAGQAAQVKDLETALGVAPQAEAPARGEAKPAERATEAGATERTAAGEQRLIPGVAPVTERQRLEAEAAKPLAGGEKAPPAGGLFDEAARAQRDLLDEMPALEPPSGGVGAHDLMPIADERGNVRWMTEEQALAEVRDPPEAKLADLVRSCKP